MNPPSNFYDSAKNRFWAGFGWAGVFTFLIVLCATRGVEMKADFIHACIAAPTAALLTGVLAATGRKVLVFCISLFMSIDF